jgi:hypothetical protein
LFEKNNEFMRGFGFGGKSEASLTAKISQNEMLSVTVNSFEFVRAGSVSNKKLAGTKRVVMLPPRMSRSARRTFRLFETLSALKDLFPPLESLPRRPIRIRVGHGFDVQRQRVILAATQSRVKRLHMQDSRIVTRSVLDTWGPGSDDLSVSRSTIDIDIDIDIVVVCKSASRSVIIDIVAVCGSTSRSITGIDIDIARNTNKSSIARSGSASRRHT